MGERRWMSGGPRRGDDAPLRQISAREWAIALPVSVTLALAIYAFEPQLLSMATSGEVRRLSREATRQFEAGDTISAYETALLGLRQDPQNPRLRRLVSRIFEQTLEKMREKSASGDESAARIYREQAIEIAREHSWIDEAAVLRFDTKQRER